MSEIAVGLGELREEFSQAFGGLDYGQFNWKPSEDMWSVGQCIDHLVVTNNLELPAIERAAKGEHTQTFWERLPFFPTMFGNILLKAIDPSSNRKFKAPKSYSPTKSEVDLTRLNDYLELSEKICGLDEATESFDRTRAIITSPISSLVTHSLETAFRVVLLHDRRHFEQAKRVTELTGFPG
ncbi:MAG: DinB family protein [Pyrinomonadaceae bacterium]